MAKTKKKQMYFPTAFAIIFGLMILFVVVSWIGQATTSKITGIGILDIFSSTWRGFKDKVDVILFIFSIGGTLGVMTKIKAIDAGIDALVNKLGDMTFILIPVLMIIFGLGGTSYGMWEETIAFIPVLIPVFKKAGYGVFTAILVILLGAGTGCLASTINPFAIGAAIKPINTAGINFTPGTLQGIRWISFILFEAVAIGGVMWMASRYKSGKSIVKGLQMKVINERFKEKKAVEFTLKRKISLSLFIFTFLLMILFYLPWAQWIPGITGDGRSFWDRYFFWITSISASGSETGGSASGFARLGDWYMISVASLFLITTMLVFAINIKEFKSEEENSEEGLVTSYMSGVKDMVYVCLLIGIASGLGFILAATKIGPLIANGVGQNMNGNFIVYGISIFFISFILSLLVPSTSGFASAFMGVFAGIAKTGFADPKLQITAVGLAVLAFIFASGLANLITPTSAALMGYTAYAGVPYFTWVKEIWKIWIVYFVLAVTLILVFSAIAQTGSSLF